MSPKLLPQPTSLLAISEKRATTPSEYWSPKYLDIVSDEIAVGYVC